MLGFEVTVKMKRRQAGTWERGRYTGGQESEQDISVSVPQPLRGNQLLLLPENRRTEESYIVYTEFALRADDESSNKLPCDIVVWRNKEFEVHNVKDWIDTDIPHYEVILIRREIVDKYAPPLPPEPEELEND